MTIFTAIVEVWLLFNPSESIWYRSWLKSSTFLTLIIQLGVQKLRRMKNSGIEQSGSSKIRKSCSKFREHYSKDDSNEMIKWSSKKISMTPQSIGRNDFYQFWDWEMTQNPWVILKLQLCSPHYLPFPYYPTAYIWKRTWVKPPNQDDPKDCASLLPPLLVFHLNMTEDK